MATYDLERLNVLLAEDNSYLRNVLADVLRQFKIGRIVAVENGQYAIEYLKELASGSSTRAVPDLVLSDLVMSPIDGLLMLRWIRSSKDSPNRFMPVIMVSGAADAQQVLAARDEGVNEFLAKPFSARAVSRYVLELIDFPRQYVATTTYFGPDRRRKAIPITTPNQRTKRDSDVTVVYSEKKIVKPTKPSDVWYFRLPNALKDRVGGLGASGPGELPMKLLEEAEANLQRAALDFTEWANGYVADLARHCLEAKRLPSSRRQRLEAINLLAHELRGQGGTFGYPLITILAKSLYDATYVGARMDDNAIEILKAHVDSMRAVLREKVSGDGGELGRELLASLKAAIERNQVVV